MQVPRRDPVFRIRPFIPGYSYAIGQPSVRLVAFGLQELFPWKGNENIVVWLCMRWDQIQTDWHLIKPSARRRWQLLTDSDLENIGGIRERLVQAVRDRYGAGVADAECDVDEFAAKCSHSPWRDTW